MKIKIIGVCMLILCTSSKGDSDYLMRILEQSDILLDEVKKSMPVYVAHIFNKEFAYLVQELSDAELVRLMQLAEKHGNDYILNGIAALLVYHMQDSEQLQSYLSEHAYGFIKKYSYLKARYTTRACGDIELSVADYVNEFGVPIEYLDTLGILRFDDKDLTSLNGVQDLSYTDVIIATFAYNCILGNSRDPQFPDNAFQGLPNILWLFLNDNNIENLPGNFFNYVQGLTILDLQNNELMTLTEGLFSGLDNLGLLRLSTNMLMTVSASDFSDLQSLDTVALDYNSLMELPADLFQSTPMLRYIFLNNNLLDSWPPSLLNDVLKLHRLDLSYNLLTSFEPESLVDSSEIILTGNFLTESQEDFLESAFPEVFFTF